MAQGATPAGLPASRVDGSHCSRGGDQKTLPWRTVARVEPRSKDTVHATRMKGSGGFWEVAVVQWQWIIHRNCRAI